MKLINQSLSLLLLCGAAAWAHAQPMQVVKDISGRELLDAFAAVEPPGWLLFVEIPLEEANALNAMKAKQASILLSVDEVIE
jgi:hypothetical protein